MALEIAFPHYVKEMIQANKSLDKLASRLYMRGGSVDSAMGYVVDVNRFARWVGRTPDDLLTSNQDWSSLINDYISDMIVKRKISRAMVNRTVVAVKKWLDVNGVLSRSDQGWGRVELPRIWRVTKDRLPTREELKRIVSASNIEDRVLAMTGIASSLRISTILALKLNQIVGLEIKETGRIIKVKRKKIREVEVNQGREVLVIHVDGEQSKNRKGYLTFLTPEASQTIVMYLKERQMRGEQLAPESTLIVSLRGRNQTTRVSAARRWRNMLKRAGLDEKGEEGKVKWYSLHFHVLRKYFKSWCVMSGVPEPVVEFFMGHRNSIAQTYFLPGTTTLPPEIVEMLEKEYRKAVPSLTVLSGAYEVQKLERVVEDATRRLEEERLRFELEKKTWEAKFEELAKTIREIKDVRERELQSKQ